MAGLLSLTPLLPILVPLLGAIVIPLLPNADNRGSLRLWGYVAVLVLTGLALGGVGLWDLGIIRAIGPAGSNWDTRLALLWTPLGLGTAVLLTTTLLLAQIGRMAPPRTASYVSITLTLLAAAIVAMGAANLLVLCLAWGVPSVGILLLRMAPEQDSSVADAPPSVWASVISTALLVLGATVLMSEQKGALILVQVQPGLGLIALTCAVALRLYASTRTVTSGRFWQIAVIELLMGLYLWARIVVSLQAHQSAVVDRTGWAAGVLVAIGLFAYLIRKPVAARTPLVLHWLTVAIIAPLLDPARGLAVSVLVTVQLASAMLAMHVRDGTESGPFGAVSYLEAIVGASLAGLPLTIGFIIHWILLQIALGHSVWLTVWFSISFGLVAFPFWQRSLDLVKSAPRWKMGPAGAFRALAVVSIAGLIVTSLGIYPGLASYLWMRGPVDLGALSYRQLISGTGVELVVLVVGAGLVPGLAALAVMSRVDQVPRGIASRYRALRRSFDVDVLHDIIALRIQRGLSSANGIVRAGEASLMVGWTILWGVALVYYIISR